MPRLRVLSGEEVCVILAEHGFTEAERRGTFTFMRKRTEDGAITLPVPDHRELTTGTLESIIRRSGLPRRQFEEAP